MHTFSSSSDTSTIEVLRNINQGKKSGAYDDATRFHYYESVHMKQSHHQDTSFKCGNIEEVSSNDTVDRKMNSTCASSSQNLCTFPGHNIKSEQLPKMKQKECQ